MVPGHRIIETVFEGVLHSGAICLYRSHMLFTWGKLSTRCGCF